MISAEQMPDRLVCSDCIHDPILRQDVRSEGRGYRCSYCDQMGVCVDLDWLADRVDEIVASRFHLTPTEAEREDYYALKYSGDWERQGIAADELIQDIAHVSRAIALDARVFLEDRYVVSRANESEENPYSPYARYDQNSPDTHRFAVSWDSFCTQVQSRARFFNSTARAALQEIFGELTEHRTPEGEGVIIQLNPGDDVSIYRARVSFSWQELQAILVTPHENIGPPPSRVARAGRMNARGIPVLYGALEAETAIAEVRAPVGSQVVVARFSPLRTLRILDFDAVQRVFVDPSHFDQRYDALVGRAAFLRQLARLIARPVMPSDEERDYLPTQVVAEYLGQAVQPPLDGLVFRSVQTGNRGRNIVLFNHSARVKPYRLADGESIQVHVETADDGESVQAVVIIEGKQGPWNQVESKKPSEDDSGEDRHSSLALDREGLQVHLVTASLIQGECHPVSWQKLPDFDEIPF